MHEVLARFESIGRYRTFTNFRAELEVCGAVVQLPTFFYMFGNGTPKEAGSLADIALRPFTPVNNQALPFSSHMLRSSVASERSKLPG